MFKLLLLIVTFSIICTGYDRVDNFTYVTAIDSQGYIYARSCPKSKQGSDGITKVYRTSNGDNDNLIDVYDWYSPRGITLGWSPIEGKITVLSLGLLNTVNDDEIALNFYKAGSLLRTYTIKDLKTLGCNPRLHMHGGILGFSVKGIRQMPPNTSEYVYVIETKDPFESIANGREIYFDTLTGDIKKP